MSLKQHHKDVIQKGKHYAETFGTPAGELVLKDLREKYYDVELFDRDPVQMGANVAARDVIDHILSLIKVAEKGND